MRVNLDAVLIYGPYASLPTTISVIPKIPSGSAAWEQLLGESLHMLKINQEAELSAQPQMAFFAIQSPARVVGIAAREQSRHKALLASGVVDALLWTTAVVVVAADGASRGRPAQPKMPKAAPQPPGARAAGGGGGGGSGGPARVTLGVA